MYYLKKRIDDILERFDDGFFEMGFEILFNYVYTHIYGNCIRSKTIVTYCYLIFCI